MVLRGDQHQAVGAEMNGLQAQGVHGPRHNAQVGSTVQDAACDFSIRFFLKVHIDLGVFRQKRWQDFRQKIGHRRGVGENPDMAPQAGAIFLQVAAQLVCLPQHAACVVKKGFAGRRQANAARFPVKKRHARVAFQSLDAAARRRQRQVLTRGGAGQVAFFGGAHKQAQIGQVKFHDRMVTGKREPSKKQKPWS